MKLVVGSSYRTRGGWRAKVVADELATSHSIGCIHYTEGGAVMQSHMTTGHFQFPATENPWDIIAEWVDPPAPPVPLECWLVYDSSGHRIATWDEPTRAEKWADDYGYTIKHMREVTGE